MEKINLSGASALSIPLQLVASTLVVGYIGMKIGRYIGGDFAAAMGFLVGLIAGFFGYIVVIVKREQ